MRTLLALAGWPDVAVPPGAWTGTDAAGRSLLLAHLGEAAAPAPAVASSEDGSVRVVLAGSLYNHRELRASLGGRHAFSGRDDAEVVVHLYRDRGVQGLKPLRGAFAVALWDARRRHLVLARDQLGLVPLYYAAERGRLAASSALPVLTALPGLAGSWDATALDAFLVLGAVPPPATLYPAIRQLHPGEVIVWEDGRVRAQRYWQVAFPERRLARAALGGMVREQLAEALRLRQAGVTAGLLLSGGLDAATLLALMVADRRPPTHAYTAAFPGMEEVRAAARLALRAGVEHVAVTEPPDWSATVEALLGAQGIPVGGPETAALHLAAGRAAADGAVVVAGVGGEEIFGGSLPARAAERVRRYRRLPGPVREGAEVWARLAPARWGGTVRSLVREERLAPVELYARSVSCFLPEERGELYTPEALAMLGETHPWSALTALFAEAASAGAIDVGDTIHYAELALRLPARAAAVTAAGAGLDVRLPLADHRVAHLVASAPSAERGDFRARQLVLCAAMKNRLPGAVLRRPHARPVPPPGAWSTGSLRALVEDTLAPERLAAQGIFRADTVTRLREEHARGHRDHGARLWALVLTTRWLARQALPTATTLRAAG